MSMERASSYKKNRKRARQPYRGSRRFDTSCRNHGSWLGRVRADRGVK